MFLRRLFKALNIGNKAVPVIPPPPPNIFQNTKHKINRIPADIRNNVWTKYHGERTFGQCYCCGIIIQRYHGGWHCSHVIARDKGGSSSVDNLRTCCRHCNLSMGNCNLYVYIKNSKLHGPGHKNVQEYLYKHNSQINDVRTNNWGRKS